MTDQPIMYDERADLSAAVRKSDRGRFRL